MPYLPSYISNAVAAIKTNPSSMAGTMGIPAGGPGHNFKARNALRQAGMQVAPGITNLETYQPSTLTGVVADRALLIATTQ